MLRLTIAAAALCVAACGSVHSPMVAKSPSGDLHARLLRLPRVATGAPCPTSPKVTVTASENVAKLGNYGFGTGPAYLSGQLDWYAGPNGQGAVVLVSPAYRGPILIRARSLSGGGTITLGTVDIPDSHRLPGETGPGVTTTDGIEVDVPGPSPSRPNLWSDWLGRLTVSVAGCYGIQVDGTSFTSLAVFEARPGPVPPG